MDESLRKWLVEGDPSIVWQTLDYLNYEKQKVEQERTKIEQEGWGRRLLENQAADGSWGEGLYSPKFVSTTYTLLLLKRLGINQEQKQCQQGATLLVQGIRKDGGVNFSPQKDARSETCITGMTLNILSYFKTAPDQVEKIYSYIKKHQMEDGGWNCQYPRKATHASFNTTLLVLEGLQSYRRMQKEQKNIVQEIEQMEAKGREFLLAHNLYKSHTTGEVIREDFMRFPFPYQWKYDVLTALDYFQSSKAPYDERLEDPIQFVEGKTEDGYLKNYKGQSGKLWFTLETVGKPSRYNTLRWHRIQNWWHKIH